MSVVEILRNITTVTAQPVGDEKYKVVTPETMQEALDSDSDEEGGMYYQNSTLYLKQLGVTGTHDLMLVHIYI